MKVADGRPIGHLRRRWFEAFSAANLAAYRRRTPLFARAMEAVPHTVHVDHIAMRSFAPWGIEHCSRPYVASGYTPGGSVTIPGGHLRAVWYKAPMAHWPNVFMSELNLATLPLGIQDLIRSCHAVDAKPPAHPLGASPESVHALYDRLPNAITWRQYNHLHALAHAGGDHERLPIDYALWTLTNGHRINHAAMMLRHVAIASVNRRLIRSGIAMNAGGGSDGLTQGSRAVGLEQSSTRAEYVDHVFACGTAKRVPGAFVEIVRRHDGFEGFLGDNAKEVFKSTSTDAIG